MDVVANHRTCSRKCVNIPHKCVTKLLEKEPQAKKLHLFVVVANGNIVEVGAGLYLLTVIATMSKRGPMVHPAAQPP